jgi:hypothetical protein
MLRHNVLEFEVFLSNFFNLFLPRWAVYLSAGGLLVQGCFHVDLRAGSAGFAGGQAGEGAEGGGERGVGDDSWEGVVGGWGGGGKGGAEEGGGRVFGGGGGGVCVASLDGFDLRESGVLSIQLVLAYKGQVKHTTQKSAHSGSLLRL